MDLHRLRQVAESACPRYGVRRMDAFGSLARGTAGPQSDVDLLVEFEAPGKATARSFFGLLHALEDSLGCRVDLLTPGSMKNPYFKQRVMREKVPVYERR